MDDTSSTGIIEYCFLQWFEPASALVVARNLVDATVTQMAQKQPNV